MQGRNFRKKASDCEKCTIRILDTHKPTVDVTEVNNMSKVIDFDPRDLRQISPAKTMS